MSTSGEVDRSQTSRRKLGARGGKMPAYPVADVIHVEVEEARLDAHDEDAGHALVIRISREIRISPGGGHPAELGHVRMSGTMNEEQHGDEGSQEHSPQDPEEEHAGEGGHGDREFRPAERPHAPQLRHVDQARDGDEHDRGQDDLRQRAQEAGEKQKAGRDGQRREREGKRRPSSRLVVHGGLRETPRHGIAVGEGDRTVGGGEGQELLTRVDLGAMLLGEGAGRRHALDVGEQEAGEGEGNDAVDIPHA